MAPPIRGRKTIMALLATAAAALLVWIFKGPTVEQRRRSCEEAAAAGDWARLQSEAEEWIDADDNSPEAWLNLGRAFERQGKYQRAAESLLEVPASTKEIESAQLGLVELYFGPLNQPQSGARVCEAILERDPKSQIANQRLIFFLAMTLQRSRLREQIGRAIEADAEPREAYIYYFFADSLKFTNAAEVTARWLAGSPESELFEVSHAIFVAELLDAGMTMDDRAAALAARASLARKEEIMRDLLDKYPHNLELLAYHLHQCQVDGNVKRAIELAAQAPVEAEDDNRFWRIKGWIHSQRDEFAEAESAYRKAIEIFPVDWGTRSLLAELLQRQQRSEEVLRLRELVERANVLRREIQPVPDARRVPPKTLAKLAQYFIDCGDSTIGETLRRRLVRSYQP